MIYIYISIRNRRHLIYSNEYALIIHVSESCSLICSQQHQKQTPSLIFPDWGFNRHFILVFLKHSEAVCGTVTPLLGHYGKKTHPRQWRLRTGYLSCDMIVSPLLSPTLCLFWGFSRFWRHFWKVIVGTPMLKVIMNQKNKYSVIDFFQLNTKGEEEVQGSFPYKTS